jgi:23S rRNA (pseudouridine1915-N3)-methyltransferase
VIELQQRLAEKNSADPNLPSLQRPFRPIPDPRSDRCGARLGAGQGLKATVIAVGRVKAPFAEADGHYRKLLRRHQPVEVIEVRRGQHRGRIQPPCDRAGSRRRVAGSKAWASWLSERRIDAQDSLLLIGARRGSLRDARLADERLSLGPQTLAHQLARVVLLEQLFRATKILAGEKYHH